MAADLKDRKGNLAQIAAITSAGALALSASFTNFVVYNGYPVWTREVGIALGVIIVLAVVAGLLYAGGEIIARMVLKLVLAFSLADLNFDGYVVALVVVIIMIIPMRHLTIYLSIIAAVVFGSNVLAASNDRSTRSEAAGVERLTGRPPLVHIVLDEHLGIEGFNGYPADVAGIKEELIDFYVGNGFRVYGGAYSEYMRTILSLPQMLSFGTQLDIPYTKKRNARIQQNRYFDTLAAAGYEIEVMQTDYLNFCANDNVVSCTVRRSSSLAYWKVP
jgi:hypothetical protein